LRIYEYYVLMTIARLGRHGESPLRRVSTRFPDEGERHMESSHIVALQTKHDGLERRIREEMNRPIPDDTILQTLKKQKLQLKQEIVAL
jgi:hypothetical protein